MAAQNVLEFTDDNFDADVIGSAVPVLVDFWAEWCMPCRMLAPTIDRLATEYTGRVKVGKLDTDASRQVAVRYGISAIPTVILFKGGQIHAKVVGLKSEADFRKLLDAAIAG